MAKKSSNDIFRTLAMLDYQGGVCFWCLRKPYPFETIHADHIVPESRGGVYTVATCISCNITKGTHSWDGFFVRRMIELTKLFDISYNDDKFPIDRSGWWRVFEFITDLDYILFSSILIRNRIYPLSKDSFISSVQYDSRTLVNAMLMRLEHYEMNLLFDLAFILTRRIKSVSEFMLEEEMLYGSDKKIKHDDWINEQKSVYYSSDGEMKEMENSDLVWFVKQSGQLGTDILGWHVQIGDTSLFGGH